MFLSARFRTLIERSEGRGGIAEQTNVIVKKYLSVPAALLLMVWAAGASLDILAVGSSHSQ